MNSNYDNEWSDELQDYEYPDEDDWDDDDSETVPCPRCGEQVYEDAPRCPNCDEYITHSRSVWHGRPLWWIALAMLAIFATTVVLVIGI